MATVSDSKRRPWLTWIDWLLSKTFAPPQMERPKRHRILLIRLDHIGDFVMTIPVIRYLKECAGFQEVDVLVGSWVGSLASEFPEIDRVWQFDAPWWIKARGLGWYRYVSAWWALPRLRRTIRQERYDYIVELRGDLRHILFFAVGSGAFTMASSRTGGQGLVHLAISPPRTELLSLENLTLIQQMFPGQEFRPRARTRLALPKPELRIGMYISARVELKQWPWRRYVELAVQVRKRWPRCHFVLFSGEDRADVFRQTVESLASEGIVATEMLASPWSGVVRSLKECSLVVGADSGLGHLAAALGVPTVTLFGPARPERFLPVGSDNARSVYVSQPCSPCLQVSCNHPSAGGVPLCMDQISVSMVVAEIVAALNVNATEPYGGPRAEGDYR